MNELNNYSHSELVEILNQYTIKYTDLGNSNTGATEHKDCKSVIDALIDEISKRKHDVTGESTITDDNIHFSSDTYQPEIV